ncbi:uncharacterized protein PHACADRAFT_100589 [Phanerochaete carnosa HHB-10118-sp]|uniref:Uncharacterized protein n=1 Tax=Phanerochaete carnosa (strain HHB-10118-sp) TaxID=650164 RepID=K5W0N6_PHACS|nr:uncharacterized protein PHACADRAFT_100589 [Phanerochaete carnosa HHB-10118-sp]EKM52434.1 hypothetical protein PHACADRAFT_100589 [Phanerochaete carnosa HHB-10118-sp]
MSATNSSDPTGGAGAGNATAPQIPPQVIAAVLEGYADGIRNPIGFVLVATIFASMLIPILIALFYFSTPTSRRQPAFILNVITILFGLGIAIWNNYLELAGVLNPTKQVSLKSVDGFAVVFGLAPWLAELVLALRLLVVFPPSQTSWRKLAAVFAFPVAVKIVRLACVITYFHNWIRETDSAANPLQAAETVDYKHSPYTKVDWFLQIFDNLYLSALFIGRLYHSQIFNAMSGRRANESTYTYPSEQNRVATVIFNIILIIDLYTDPNHIVNTVYLLFVNYYISIIGVVFATGEHAFYHVSEAFWLTSLQYGARASITNSNKLWRRSMAAAPRRARGGRSRA